ncbi:MAG: TolC family protein, partial [Sphingobacteriales bacterium]|nr:TolC family protein [Sphingobacteriales bacterium]
MKHKITLIAAYTLIASFLSIGNARAQDSTKKITLQEAIDLSIKNSKQLKVSQAKMIEAKASLKETLDHRLPDFNISGSYLYLPITPNVELHTKPATSSGSGSSGAAASTPSISQAMYGIASISYPI